VIVDLGPGGDGRALTRAALDGGAPVIQVRVKGTTDRERYELTEPIADLCATAGVACIVNDRADIALALGADGVHLGAEDMPVRAARGVLGPDFVVGGTARDPATARRLQEEGATYLGVGPVYATATKDGLPEPIGLDGLRAVVDAVTIPVIAIAGITAERVPAVVDAGAHGVAVVGAVAAAADPRDATAALVAALEAMS
jgi:thiamine-phosphate pyrophosphorylase